MPVRKEHIKPSALILAQKFNDDIYVILLLGSFHDCPGCGSWSELPSWTRRSGSSRPRKRNLARWETAWQGEKQLGGVRNCFAGWETAWRSEKQLGGVRNSLARWETTWRGEKQLDGVRNSLAGVRNSLAGWERGLCSGCGNGLVMCETAPKGDK